MKWFTKAWWQYLLEKPTDPGYCSWWTRFWCRVQGHPDGVWWFTLSRGEPDMRCKRCHDDLG